jgi:aminoglycoside 6'-N-acetyltransferase I
MDMENFVIRAAGMADCDAVVEMRVLLWPESSREEQAEEFDASMRGVVGTLPLAILVAEDLTLQDGSGGLIGFLEVGLRSHADGCDVARPVGYVEGWFIREGFRGRGIGAALMRAAEEWSRGHGCREIASDALIDNEGPQSAHEALGFEVVDRCVHYRKGI